MEESIDALGLSKRTHDLLAHNGIETVSQLADMTDWKLAALRGMGKRALNEIKEKLEERHGKSTP